MYPENIRDAIYLCQTILLGRNSLPAKTKLRGHNENVVKLTRDWL